MNDIQTMDLHEALNDTFDQLWGLIFWKERLLELLLYIAEIWFLGGVIVQGILLLFHKGCLLSILDFFYIIKGIDFC